MTTTTLPIIQKIQRLLVIGGGSVASTMTDAQRKATEIEANAAMGKVQELLAQYNLSLAEIAQAPGSSKSATEEGKRVKETHKRGAMYKYQQDLWSTIAHCNYCWHWLTPVMKNGRKVNNKHYFVGSEANVMAVTLMGDYLEATINRLCPWQGKDCVSRSAISWKEGCATRLRSRLLDMKMERERASDEVKANESGSTAIALRDVTQAEYEKNYDFLYGEGAYARLLERRRLREAEAETTVTVVAPKETEKERIKREAKEKRDQARWDKKHAKQWANKDIKAWYAGHEKGAEIGLDAQVSGGGTERRIA